MENKSNVARKDWWSGGSHEDLMEQEQAFEVRGSEGDLKPSDGIADFHSENYFMFIFYLLFKILPWRVFNIKWLNIPVELKTLNFEEKIYLGIFTSLNKKRSLWAWETMVTRWELSLLRHLRY